MGQLGDLCHSLSVTFGSGRDVRAIGIVNRFDEVRRPDNSGFGVGFQLLENAAYDPADVTLLLTLLDLRRRCYGDGIVAIDCGANIGVHSVEWARHMTGWGIVIAIEAQERIYYALAFGK